MDDSKAVERAATADTQLGAAASVRPSDELLQSRFRRALASPVFSASASESNTELVCLLERACSAMYVGEKNVKSQRIVLMLDHVLAGVAAEIVRDGVHLTIRLYARTHTALRLMSSQRASLVAALGSSDKNVDVTVVFGAPGLNGDDDSSEHSK